MNEPNWCERCNGYGSSLKEPGERCTACGGTGIASDSAVPGPEVETAPYEPKDDGSDQ